MPNSQGDPLLTLYSEKMKYLGECHKVYYWMLALFVTGLVVSAGFLVKNNNNEYTIPYLAFGAPFLINAWCAGYLFCYWHNNLLSQNIDYIEKLIGKKINKYNEYNESFPTWYSNFFGSFTDVKWFIRTLYIILALMVFLLDVCCIGITFFQFEKLDIYKLLGIDESLWNECILFDSFRILYVVLTLVPVCCIHLFHDLFRRKQNKLIETRGY